MMQKIPSLDGIRALAVSIVIISHAGLGHIVPGGFGVTIFFFLSGYLIATILKKEVQDTGSINLKLFYYRRALRILPPFYIIYFSCLAISTTFDNHTDFLAVASQALMLTNYQVLYTGEASIAPGTLPYWSLSVEEHYYIVFPLLLLYLSSKKIAPRDIAIKILLPLCLLAPIWRYVVYLQFENSASWNYYASDTRFDSILWGALFALIAPVQETRNTALKKIPLYDIFIILTSITAILATLAYRNEIFRETIRYTIQAIALYPLFSAAIKYHDSPIFRWLNFESITKIGVYSYTMYLLHIPVMESLHYAAPSSKQSPLLTLIFVIPTTLLISWFMYRTIEAPLYKVRKRLHTESKLKSGLR